MKKKLIIYSGHCEVVGGDVKYIVDVLNHLDKSHFDIVLYTDARCHFYDWAKNWLNFDLRIEYLGTMPHLFKPNFFEKFVAKTEQLPLLGKFWGIKLKGAPLSKYFGFLYKIVSLYHLRLKITNFHLFHKMLSAEKPDIFWFNNGGYPGKEAGLIAVVLAKKFFHVSKVIMTFHNVPAPKMMFKPTEVIYDRLANSSLDYIIAVSQILKTKLVEERNFSSDKIKVLYCGLEDKAPLTSEKKAEIRKAESIPQSAKVFILTGNLDERRKGHDLTIRALGKLKNKFDNFIFLVVGRGLPERLQELKDLSAENGLQNNIRFLGQRYDIHELNSIADIAFVPSFGAEATPYTIKEASRAARPVITTREGGCAEGIIEHITGEILNNDDETEFSQLIFNLLQDENKLSQMGTEGRKFYLSHFEMKKIAEAHEKILNS